MNNTQLPGVFTVWIQNAPEGIKGLLGVTTHQPWTTLHISNPGQFGFSRGLREDTDAYFSDLKSWEKEAVLALLTSIAAKSESGTTNADGRQSISIGEPAPEEAGSGGS
jgi:hypothetical protein